MEEQQQQEEQQQEETATRMTQEFVLDENIAAAIASAAANGQQHSNNNKFHLSSSSAFSTPTQSTTSSVKESPQSERAASVTSLGNTSNSNIEASTFTPVVLVQPNENNSNNDRVAYLENSMAYSVTTPGISSSMSSSSDSVLISTMTTPTTTSTPPAHPSSNNNKTAKEKEEEDPVQPQLQLLEMEMPETNDNDDASQEEKKDESTATKDKQQQVQSQLKPPPPPPSSPSSSSTPNQKTGGRLQISMATPETHGTAAETSLVHQDASTIARTSENHRTKNNNKEQTQEAPATVATTLPPNKKTDDLSSSLLLGSSGEEVTSSTATTNLSNGVPPPPPYSPGEQRIETPRVSNLPVKKQQQQQEQQTTGPSSSSSHQHQQQQQRQQQQHSPEWSKNVDSVAASVNLALSKLRDFATPYMAASSQNKGNATTCATTSTTTTDAIPPDAVDTSTESTENPSKNGDDWNLKELVQELQQKQVQDQQEAAPDEDPHHMVAHAVNAMISSLSVANNARKRQQQQQQQQQQHPPPHHGKPPARGSRKHQSSSSSAAAAAAAMTTPLPSATVADGLVTSLQHVAAEGCAVLIPPRKKTTTEMTRAVTPIARMRDTSSQQQQNKVVYNDEDDNIHSATVTTARRRMEERTRSDTSDAAVLEKHRRWKEKMKTVGKTREDKKRKNKRDSSSRRPRFEKDETSEAGAPGCQDGFMHLVESFWSSRCGQWDDATEMAPRDDSTAGSFSTEDSHDESSNNRLNTSMEVTEASEPITEADSRLSSIRSLRSPLKDETERFQKHELSDSPALTDRNFIRSFIANTKEKGIDLIVHKRHHRQSFAQPKKVKAFIRSGKEQSSGLFSTPTLEWRSEKEFYEKVIDLFDIKSVGKASALQLEQYPLAIPGRSVMLRTNGGSNYVFETRDEGAAFQFIHGLRWLVARLSFNLIIGNLNISCELLNIDDGKYPSQGRQTFPETPAEEARWTRAMNDATNVLVEKSPCSF